MSAHKGFKRLGYLIGFFVVIGLLVLGWYATRPGPLAFAAGKRVALADYGGHPAGVPADFQGADPIAKGRYLAQAADCEACHTDENGTPFAGGRAFKTPFGTLYSPNITPDAQTGIGQYTDAEFLEAVHKGVGRGGKKLYPAFPYAAYTYITDEDVLAIKAYLFSLTPVKNAAPENALSFPFNQRWLMTFWGALFNPDSRFQPIPEQSAEWNRGAYLAEALAHCGDCHTPRNLVQGLDNARKFGGTLTNGWRAYNVTADKTAGVGGWSDAELAQYLASGHAAGRGSASGPMGEAVELSFRNLTASDIQAIVTYLRTIPALESKDLPAPKTEVASADPKQGVSGDANPHGKKVYAGACASCHGWTGASALSPRATLTGVRAINDPTATNVAQMILHGTESKDSSGRIAMPAFGDAYNDEEIAAVSNYVTARFGASPSSITPEDVRKMRAME